VQLGCSSQWAVESCCDPALLSNESLQPAANSTENDRSACSYDDEESIDGDALMSSPGESDIEDDDLCDISPNFIAKAADLSHHHSPLLSFEVRSVSISLETWERPQRHRQILNIFIQQEAG
jgi:hypothetical protein